MGLNQKLAALEAETYGTEPPTVQDEAERLLSYWHQHGNDPEAVTKWAVSDLLAFARLVAPDAAAHYGEAPWEVDPTATPATEDRTDDEDDEPETRDERADRLTVGQTYGEYGDDPADYVTITRVKHKGDTVKVKGTTRDGETTRRHDRDEVVALVVPVMAGPGILTPIDTTNNVDGVPVIIERGDSYPFGPGERELWRDATADEYARFVAFYAAND